MDVVVSQEHGECPPCVKHLGTTAQFIPPPLLDVFKSGSIWVVSQDPLVIGHPNIRVTWNLAEVMKPIHWGGKTVTKVEIYFDCAPPPLNSSLGPFISVQFDSGAQTLMGHDQNPPATYGGDPYFDCYRYNLLVYLNGQQEPERIFPIDPQIDNLAPPGEPYQGGD